MIRCTSSIIKRILCRQLPTVSVDMGKLTGKVASAGIDNRNAATKIASHVLELDHRQITILSLEMLPDGFSGLVNGAATKRSAASYSPPVTMRCT